MASYNKVILIGNLTRDPELRYTAKGMAIAKLGLAVGRKWRNEAGEMQEETTFVEHSDGCGVGVQQRRITSFAVAPNPCGGLPRLPPA